MIHYISYTQSENKKAFKSNEHTHENLPQCPSCTTCIGYQLQYRETPTYSKLRILSHFFYCPLFFFRDYCVSLSHKKPKYVDVKKIHATKRPSITNNRHVHRKLGMGHIPTSESHHHGWHTRLGIHSLLGIEHSGSSYFPRRKRPLAAHCLKGAGLAVLY